MKRNRGNRIGKEPLTMKRQLQRLVIREPIILSELVRQLALVLMLIVILIRPDTPARLFAAGLILALSALLSWALREFIRVAGWPQLVRKALRADVPEQESSS